MKTDLFKPLLTKGDKCATLKIGTIGMHKDGYFDYTASGLAYEPIEERIRKVLTTYANTHSKESSMASLTNDYYDDARENLALQLEVDKAFAVLPSGCGATRAIKRLQELLGLYIPPATRKRLALNMNDLTLPVVIVGPYEHHSNEISYREAMCETVRIGLDADGLVDLQELENKLIKHQGREIIGAFCIASNVSGVITPYAKISKLLRKYGAIVCFDGAASSPYMNIECELYDALVLSPHKLLGGPGSCGLLVVRRSIIDTEVGPTFAGGGTVLYVSRSSHHFDTMVETREDAGTPGILQLIRASLAYQLRNELGFAWIKENKEHLLQHFVAGLKQIDGCTIYGNQDVDNIGIVSFNIEGLDPYDLCTELSNQGIQTRAGCACAGPYGHDLLGYEDDVDFKHRPGWLRVSIHFTQELSDVTMLLERIKESINVVLEKNREIAFLDI